MCRHIALTLVAATAAMACRTPPPPIAEKPQAEQPPPAPPFSLTEMSATQSLFGATLRLEGKVNGVSDRELKWVAKSGDQTVGEGTTTIEPGEDGTFSTDLAVKLADSLEGLAPYQTSDTFDVVVHASLGSKLSGDRAVSLRAPQLPTVLLRTVQSEKTGTNTIGVIYYIKISNPNLFDLQMDEMNYKGTIDGKAIGAGSLPGAALPASATTEFDLQPLEANTSNVGKDIGKLMKQSTLDWALDGTVVVSGANVPFHLSGKVPLSG